MKKILQLLYVFSFAFVLNLNAQNSEGKATDAERISITPVVNDQEIPQAAKNLLLNKMTQICTRNGMAGDGSNPFFIMDASIDVLSKELTPTAPPMHALNLQVNFFIMDAINGNIYSQASIEVKGVGTNETKAYMMAIKSISETKGAFKAMVDRGKVKILEFYNSECDYIVSKALALKKQGNNTEAIEVLKSVPSVSRECYVKCLEILSEIDPSQTITDEAVLASDQTTSPEPEIGGAEIELDNNIFLVYKSSKFVDDKLILYFDLVNRSNDEYNINDYGKDTRIIDGEGKEHKVERVVTAGVEGKYVKVTIVNGSPISLECQFEKVMSVSLFEYKYKGKNYSIKDLSIE